MPERREARPSAMVQAVSFFRVWGGMIGTIIFVVAFAVLGYANFESRLAAVELRSATDASQNTSLYDHETRLVIVEQKVKPITQVSWETWGAVQKDVRDNAKDISDLTDAVWRFHSRGWTSGIQPPVRE